MPCPVHGAGARGAPRRVAGWGLRVRSPLWGGPELALLHDRWEAVRAGEGQVVSLVGPPGMGTRLLTEFGGRLAPDQVPWYRGHCPAYGQAIPYLPVRDLLRQLCALVEGDHAAAHTAAVQHRLHACGISAAEDVALVGQLLDLPVAPELLAQLSPEARRARTFALLGHLIRQEAQQRPLVLAVEDVHWIDPTSEAWLGSLVERLAGTAVLLLVTARPGYQPPWGTHARVTQLALPPRAEESQAIVVTVPGTAQLPAARCQQIVAHGAGNPFLWRSWRGMRWKTISCHAGTGDGARGVGGPPRPPPPGGQTPVRTRPSLAPRCPGGCCSGSPDWRRTPCIVVWRTSRTRSCSMRRGSSRTRSTPSRMP